MATKRSGGGGSTAAVAILTLFGLPLFLFGLMLGLLSLGTMSEDGFEDGLLGLIGALVFGGAGLAMVLAAISTWRRSRDERRRRALHPDEPWLWRHEWAEKRIASSKRVIPVAAWVGAIAINLVLQPAWLFIIPGLADGDGVVLIAAVFPLIGFGLLAWVIRVTRRRLRFGRSFLELESPPGVVGGELRAVLLADLGAVPEDGVELKLCCVALSAGTDHDGSPTTVESERWSTTVTISAQTIPPHGDLIRLPVTFEIPPSCEPTSMDAAQETTVWRVHAQAKLPDFDYRERFEVPVFKMPGSAQGAVAAR